MKMLLSTDEFRARARADAKFSGSIQRLATGAATEVQGVDRTLRFCFSDGSVDRAGDQIEVDGWDLDSFEKNPVALWAHDSSSPPIGRAAEVGVVGKRLMGDIEFAKVEDYPFADTIYRLCKGKFINAVSVGFLPIDWQWSTDKERPFGIDFQKQELLEITVCPVPCNANALAEARSKGIDTGPLRAWAEKVLDHGDSILIPRTTLENIFKDARTPHSARAKYRALIEEKNMTWKCSASRDFPIDENADWDGAAAEKSIFDACGFDGDNPDAERAAQHFLAHDPSQPTAKGSYKLPFAHIVDGKSKAVAAGLHAAASRLSGTDIPDDVKTSAEAVIEHYRTEMGEKAWRKAMGEDNEGAPVVGANCGRERAADCGMKDPADCAIHAPKGDCGREQEETCGMADPMECSTHYATTKARKTRKAGRRISSENKALLEKALDHHAQASKCIKDVLASNDPEPDEDSAPESLQVLDPPPATNPAERMQETRALLASIKH